MTDITSIIHTLDELKGLLLSATSVILLLLLCLHILIQKIVWIISDLKNRNK